MSRLSAIYSILSGNANLTGQVSTRIYPVFPPQNTAFPFVVFTTGTSEPTDQKDTTSPIDEATLQVDVYARTALSAETIQDYVRAALDGYSGTAATVKIRQIYYNNSTAPDHDPDLGVFWFSTDYVMKIER